MSRRVEGSSRVGDAGPEGGFRVAGLLGCRSDVVALGEDQHGVPGRRHRGQAAQAAVAVAVLLQRIETEGKHGDVGQRPGLPEDLGAGGDRQPPDQPACRRAGESLAD